jgi:glycosyltransferase involved in cell wall biosynthesis
MTKKILVARGGKLSPFSGFGSTHDALIERLADSRVEGYKLGKVAEYDSQAGPLRRVWRRWFSHPKVVEEMAKFHDIVHITDQEQAGLTPTNGKSIITVHDLFHLYPSIRNGVAVGKQRPGLIRKKDLRKVKNGIRRASLLICISKYTQEECEMRFPGIPTTWVPHAIDLNKYQKKMQRPEWFSEGVNLLIIGSEEPRKRVEFAVEVCGGLDVTLHKLGAESSPDARKRIEALANKVDCKLNWVGQVDSDEKIAALQHADALLFPSVAEGFGLPPLEAYAAGTVALVADAPAHNEIPLEQHILPYDDIEMWRAAIEELEDESDAVKAQAEEFSIDKWAERLKSAYDSL